MASDTSAAAVESVAAASALTIIAQAVATIRNQQTAVCVRRSKRNRAGGGRSLLRVYDIWGKLEPALGVRFVRELAVVRH